MTLFPTPRPFNDIHHSFFVIDDAKVAVVDIVNALTFVVSAFDVRISITNCLKFFIFYSMEMIGVVLLLLPLITARRPR